jgi:putative acetyltransferase
MPLTITPISPYDPIAEELIAELTAEMRALYNDEEDGSGRFKPADVDVPRAVFLVAFVDERPVGCGALRPVNATTAEVKRMYVRPEMRGQGLSRRILEALEQSARGFDYERVILETGHPQVSAVKLYHTSGYQVIPNYAPYIGDPDSICFEKNLTSLPSRTAP